MLLLAPPTARATMGATLSPLPWGWWVLGAWGSLVLHELSHALAAVGEGIVPDRLNAALFLGFMPVVYVRIPAIYTVSPQARARIWSAGIHCNAAMGATLGAVWLLAPAGTIRALTGALALLNLVMVKANLMPFYKTDGYFLLTLLLREPNLQERAWRAIRGLVRAPRGPTRWLLISYGLGLLALLILGVESTVRWAFHRFGVAGAVAVLLAPPLTMLWARLMRRRIHPWWEALRSRGIRCACRPGGLPSTESRADS